ncbi:MAG: ribosome-associated translation inhibitor RaiA [Pirellulaceae bacterium]|nr:ribosome-associated translation inhibitor RaiA [Pirellulaceae bacterium]
MQITISARHGNVSEETQQKITEKVGKLPRYFDKVTGIQVTIDLSKTESPKLELVVSAEHTDEFIASSGGDNVWSALDSAIHKMEQQLKKHKEKVTGHRATGLGHIEVSTDEIL